MLSTVAGNEILKIVRDRDVLRLNRTEEVLHDRVGVVAEADLDRTFESMDVTVVARTLVGLVLLHEWNKLLSSPALGLEVVVVRSRCTSVHHEVDAGASAEDVGTRDNGTSATEPFRGPGVVEGSCLAVELHVLGVNTRTVYPWVLLAHQPLAYPGLLSYERSSCSLRLQ